MELLMDEIPHKFSKGWKKNYKTLPLTITEWITDEMKFHWRILGGVWKILDFIEKFKFNY
jgi:hypothetical protein